MNFDDYQIDAKFYDEFLDSDRNPREHALTLYQALSQMTSERMSTIQDHVTHSFSDEGISFTLYDQDEATERIIPIDSIPRVIPMKEWLDLESGLKQRLAALNQFIYDIYHDAKIVKDGVIPLDLIKSCPQYRLDMQGVDTPLDVYVGICGSDLVRTHDGYRVLEDNLRVPSGVSYMIANRRAVKSHLPRMYRQSKVLEVEHYGRFLFETLRELAPTQPNEPSIALHTPGIHNAAFYEHVFLADEIGAELVEGKDLVVSNGFVYMRTTSGLRKVDVIYRRIDDDFIDPLVFNSDSVLGVPGLMHAYKLGNVSIVNAPGTGVADNKSIYVFVPDMIRYYLAEEPILKNVDTHLCRNKHDLEYTLDNLQHLVVKTVGGSGGYDMLMGPQATEEERNDYANRIRENPANFIAQPQLQLSQSPCWIDNRLQPRCVDLRPFVLQGARTRLVGGAFCRVALEEGSYVVNSSQGGGGKDVWVVQD